VASSDDLSTKSVTQLAIDEIKGMITRGELKPGDRLPREPDLAAALGLSRSSLREAVRALTLIRILETRQGDGTYVTSLEPELLLETVRFVADLQQDHLLRPILEVRRLLEASATGLAAQHITEAELATLAELVQEMDTPATVEALVENDLAFHRTIAGASRNIVLASLLESFSTRTSRARVWRGLTQAGALEQTRMEHRAIHQALVERRADLASSLMTVHISGVESWLELALA
jgi:GntR family transcriptional regulator, transcriptional repressor for pyruvate dehydrogenase complex